MTYILDYAFLAKYGALLTQGIGITLALICVGAVLGLLSAVACNWLLLFCPRPVRIFVKFYIEFIRNTPFLIQLFFIFFGLPRVGITMPEMVAAMLAITVNLSAYAAEIIRAGLQTTQSGQWEAGASLGMTRNQTFWHIVLVPALQKV